jgi:hypothetical protein
MDEFEVDVNFSYEHLKDAELQSVSKPLCETARAVFATLPDNRERTKALDHLLYAKDAAVRSFIIERKRQERLARESAFAGPG